MSLISQNVVVKTKVKKNERKDDEGKVASILGGGEEVLDEGLDVDVIKSHKRKKNKRSDKEDGMLIAQEELEMQQLGSFLFGSVHSPVRFGKGDEEEGDIGIGGDDAALFVVDRSGNSDFSVYEEGSRDLVEPEYAGGNKLRKPVWVDYEEEKAVVNISNINRLRKLRKEEGEKVISGSTYVSRLRAQHAKLNPGTEWAQFDFERRSHDSDEESEVVNEAKVAPGYQAAENIDDILRTNANLVVKRGAKLLPGQLVYSSLTDANKEDPCNGVLNSVHFHRNSQLMLAGGLDKKLRFFQIDGKKNSMMDSIFLEDCPIVNASFLPDGSQAIVSGNRKFFYSIDISKGSIDRIGPLTGREEKSLKYFEVSPDSRTIAFVGNEGYILLVSSRTKELIGTVKMNGSVRSLAFTPDGQQLLSSGGDGQVYHWDLRTRTCIHKGVDEGSIEGTSLCTSPVGNLFAAGSSSGIVNVYNRDEFLGGKRKPIKTLGNLTSTITCTKFNHDAQILAICSRNNKGMKLVHVPSFTVFSNWPDKSVQIPTCLDFSPNSGFMAVGNAAGKVRLFKLHHYPQA